MNAERHDDSLAAAQQHVKLADAKILQAEFAPEDEREVLYSGAKDILLRAEGIKPGTGSWKLACISGRLGQGELCQKWLERGHRFDALPSKDDILKSPYLTRVKGQKWLKKLIKSL